MAVSTPSPHSVRAPAPLRKSAITALVAAATLAASLAPSFAQVELKTYEDEKGYINVKALTCAQLAGTFQEDANFLGVWYAGWFNGHNKKHSFNLERVQAGTHDVIVYCKSNPDKKVIDAIGEVLNGAK